MCRKCDSYQGHHRVIYTHRYSIINLLKFNVKKNIGLVWLKDDFRLKRNLALTEATKNHDQVVAFFLYKKKKFDDQEAQKWWVCESIQEFKKKLNNLVRVWIQFICFFCHARYIYVSFMQVSYL